MGEILNESEHIEPFEVIFRTLLKKTGNLMIPFINEVFKNHVKFSDDARIDHDGNEKFVPIGKERQILDDFFEIDNDLFSFECENTYDGTASVRFEDSDLNLGFYQNIEDIPVHYVAILYCRKGPQAPDISYVRYFNHETFELRYPIKEMNLADYTIDELVEKRLYILLSFYPFNLPLERYNQDESSNKKIRSDYHELMKQLNRALVYDDITVKQYEYIVEMMKEVTRGLTINDVNTRNSLIQMIEDDAIIVTVEEAYNEGYKKGFDEGYNRGLSYY